MKNIYRSCRNELNYASSFNKIWKTDRKIVVFESDDWGAERMPSKEIYNYFLEKGFMLDKCHYSMFDSLAEEDDLTALFEVLSSVKDKNNNPAVFTANCIMANPEYDKIKISNYQEYHYETFIQTLNNKKKCNNSFELWKEGYKNKIFHPQYHGREHLNIYRWMEYLQLGSKETIQAFNLGVYGISTTVVKEKRKSFMAALEYDSEKQKEKMKEVIIDGLQLFEKHLKYKSKSFIPPNYILDRSHEGTLESKGVKYIQGGLYKKEVTNYPESNKYSMRYSGQRNCHNQTSIVRNVFFEPSEDLSKDWVSNSLKEIKRSFRWKQPAVIGTHRVNYIGVLDEKNRQRNLKLFKKLLNEITKNWPDVEFMTTPKLGVEINKLI